jgi:two-component system, NarL family, invasion response regulator UvrY
MIRIGIVDDHDIVREGIRRILECHKDLVVVGMANNGLEALKLLKKQKIDVLLLDLDMPDMDGLEVTKQAVPMYPDTKILILTMHDDQEYAERVMKAGATGFILKASSPNELPNIVRRVASGAIHVDSTIMEKTAMKSYRQKDQSPTSRLSDREFQIIKRLVKGMSQKDIASELNLSMSTVATHKRRLMEKLNLKNNSDIIRFAINNGIIETKK